MLEHKFPCVTCICFVDHVKHNDFMTNIYYSILSNFVHNRLLPRFFLMYLLHYLTF